MGGGGCCRLQIPLKPALAIRETVESVGGTSPPFQCNPGRTGREQQRYTASAVNSLEARLCKAPRSAQGLKAQLPLTMGDTWHVVMRNLPAPSVKSPIV